MDDKYFKGWFYDDEEVNEFLDLWDKESDALQKRIELEKKKKKCECGAEKTRTPHSEWCPKYKK